MWITLTDPSGDPVYVNLDQCERVVPNGKDLHGGLYDSKARSIVGRAGGRDTPVTEPLEHVMKKTGEGWITLTDTDGLKIGVNINEVERFAAPGKGGLYNGKTRAVISFTSNREVQVLEPFEQVAAMIEPVATT
jgi:hypothetical protein